MSSLETSLDPVFGVAAAREAAAHWGSGDDAALELLCVSENATYVVRDERSDEPAVLRLNRPGYHGHEALASELAWTADLRASQVVCTPGWRPRSRRTGGPRRARPGRRTGPPRRPVRVRPR